MIKTPRLVKSVLSTFVTQIISWVLTFSVMLYLPRYVGAAGLGKLAFASSFIAIFGAVVPLGTSKVLIRDIARDRNRTGELLLSALILRIPLALVMTVIAISAVRLLGYPEITRTLVAFMALGMVTATANDALASALQGQEKLPRQSVAVLVEKFLFSALTIVLVIFRAPLWTLAMVGLFTSTVSLCVNLTAFAPLFSTLRWPTRTTVRYVVAAGMPFVGWIIFQTLYGQTDPIILSFVTNDMTVGWYAVAFRLICTTLVLPGALTTALFPTLSRLHKDDLEAFQILARRMLSLVLLCGIPIALLFICQPDRLIALMHYPKEFTGGIPVLRVGGVGVFLYFAAAVLGTTVIASDRQAKMFYSSLIATVVGIPACFICSYITHIFWKNGAIGAMFSDVAIEAYLVLSYLQMVPLGTFNKKTLWLLGRSLLASLPFAVLLVATAKGTWGLWILIPATAIYMLMCWALNCFDPEFLELARKLFVRRAKV